jgi:hypothetical protein
MVALASDLRKLFWEYDDRSLSWEKDRDLITARILSSGTWTQVRWLRRQLGDPGLAAWITARQGRGLDARRLRFWQTVLGLPKARVDEWLARPDQQIWNRRLVR